jgi:hypothetical protein
MIIHFHFLKHTLTMKVKESKLKYNLKIEVMKKISGLLLLVVMIIAVENVQGQVSTGVDLYSSYVWRGTQYCGPSIQPYIGYTAGGFSIGTWGSAGFNGADNKAGYMEMDLYTKYAFKFGLSLGLTDYYYPGTKFFDTSKETGAHGLEVNLGYTVGGLSLAGNYIVNQAGGAATAGGDKYFEVDYNFKDFGLFAGAGDGWHTTDGKFKVVNVGITSGKTIKITDSFSIPVKGSIILNPATEQFFIVVGVSL